MSQDEKPKLYVEPEWRRKDDDDEAQTSDAAPKIHVDSDWKAEAQAEKERLARKESTGGAEKEGPGAGRDRLPPADVRGLIGFITQQAIAGLGMMGDPKTGRVIVDLEGSKYWIDMLEVVQAKTKGNLEPDEGDELREVLVELRARFVQITQMIAKQPVPGATEPPPA